jgi:hypothetical protein
MSSFVKFIYYTSVLYFLFHLFFSYYQFPDVVKVGYSSNVGMSIFYPKQTLFYWCGGVFIVVNILILIIKRLIPVVRFSVLPIPNKAFWLASTSARESLIEIVVFWFNGINALFNLMIGSILFFIFMVTVVEFKNFTFFIPFIYVILGLMLIWFCYLFVRLNQKNYEI